MKPISLSIKATQRDRFGEDTTIDSYAEGVYFEKGHTKYIRYTTAESSKDPAIRTTIKINPDHVVVIRDGGITYRQEYRVGESCASAYGTPHGDLELQIKTDEMRCDIQDGNGTLFLGYDVFFAKHWQLYNQLEVTVKEDTAHGYEGNTEAGH